MARALLVLGCAAALAACGPPHTKVDNPSGLNPANFRRVGILPFADSKGEGRDIASELARRLAGTDYEVVDSARLEKLYKGLKLERSGGLSLQAMADIRHDTGAEALVFGQLDPEWREASVLMIETEMGEVVFDAKLRPKGGGPFKDRSALVSEALRLFSVRPSMGSSL